MTSPFMPYSTLEEIHSIVQKFESCNFAQGEFHHSDHLTVALIYALESGEEEACERMRAGLQRLLTHYAKPDAYHETITVFWIKLVKRLLDSSDRSQSIVQLANAVISRCGDPQLIGSHFSRELRDSVEARRNWIEPDLKPIQI